jgi:hypothetical protein
MRAPPGSRWLLERPGIEGGGFDPCPRRRTCSWTSRGSRLGPTGPAGPWLSGSRPGRDQVDVAGKPFGSAPALRGAVVAGRPGARGAVRLVPRRTDRAVVAVGERPTAGRVSSLATNPRRSDRPRSTSMSGAAWPWPTAFRNGWPCSPVAAWCDRCRWPWGPGGPRRRRRAARPSSPTGIPAGSPYGPWRRRARSAPHGRWERAWSPASERSPGGPSSTCCPPTGG